MRQCDVRDGGESVEDRDCKRFGNGSSKVVGRYITEIKATDLKLNVVPNLSEAKNNKKIRIYKNMCILFTSMHSCWTISMPILI